MDHVNNDNWFDLPDTPNRSAARDLSVRSCVNMESDLSTSGNSGYGNVATEHNGNRRNVNGSGRRLFMRPPRSITNSMKSEPHANSSAFGMGVSVPLRHGDPFKVSSVPNSKEKHNLHPAKSGNTELKSQISSQQDRSVGDLTKQSGSTHVFTKTIPSSSASKGKETADLSKLGISVKSHLEKDYAIDAQLRARKDGSANSSKVIGQKRLVRNGCISPHNIAKAKKPAQKEDNSVLTHGISTSLTSSSAGTSSGSAKELMSKDGISTIKGKGVLINSSSSKGRDVTHPSSRSSITIDEKAKETSDSSRDVFRSFDESCGWRSTRNRYSNMNLSLSNVSGESAAPVGPSPGTQCCQINGPRTVNAVKKRLKQGPASSSHGECSTSVPDDLDVILLTSPESRISTGSTRNQNHVGTGVEPVIVVDSPSSSTRPEGSRVVCSGSRKEDARARQLEADERLAQELQEQLYNEAPSFATGEIDEDVALALVQEDILHASSGGENLLSSLNGPSVTNARRRQSRNASTASRRVSQARASTSSRMARLRNRFPGQPRTLSSARGRNSLFPPNMDVDMRMHILETLEAFSNMDVDRNLLQTQRDFNENDYEMLLALDENNHQHGGASVRQINGLPQSTVQNESLQEACAVCLETPTVGDVIRHLPCLHKFHKDCIDPWLTRKTSCPVCKCSIT